MDPLIAVVATAGGALAGTTSVAWHLGRQIRRVEAHAADLRHRLRAEQHAANHDPLTGLPNRRGFFRIADPLAAEASHRPLVAVVLDVDNFKQVNDRLGHAAGDEALVTIAGRFSAWAAGEPWLPADPRGGPPLVARLGGDEFAGLLATTTTDHRWLHHAAWRLTRALATPMHIAGHQINITGSVGLSPVAAGGSVETALRHADAAMYSEKPGYPEKPGYSENAKYPERKPHDHPHVTVAGGDGPGEPVGQPRHRHPPYGEVPAGQPAPRPYPPLVDVTTTIGGQPT